MLPKYQLSVYLKMIDQQVILISGKKVSKVYND